jgi:myosin-crossreactive antigen
MKQTLNLKNAQLEPLSEIEMMQIDGGDIDGTMVGKGPDFGYLIRGCQSIKSACKSVWNWWSSLERKGTS